ncbi:T9SS C-terminal target domain-containing protein [Maribellus comscasis]|uniref:T9SS C-terminal target domain-containing protein n=1 Tax=Maribellus comscasis TaxID=2681766 RepID=A0A6I6JNG8_9BACT|nr:T9SS C-terminal target domain-containing protein [Maribellus comscasis]QGY44496.1 T9SS C-terminal target domain-containing protein [Maribellus comscasis]
MKKILSMLFLLMYFISCSTESNSVSEKPEDKNKKTVLKVVPQSFIAEIPLQVEESSGLLLYNNLLWTFNDSGGENKLFGLDFSGEIKKEVAVENAINVDWEDIAQDDKHIYIGDFGNNNGERKNLKIYKIKKSDIDSMDTVEAVEIKFSYKEQTDFNYQPLSNSFDCEAITDFNGELIIFTKDWVNETTSVYKIPKTEGEYLLTLTDTFNVNGLVTGADISPDEKTLAMVGYKDFKPIVWVFSDITENGFFGGKEIYMELDDIFSAQTEGICFTGNDSLLISCERTATYVQQIFLIDLKAINN